MKSIAVSIVSYFSDSGLMTNTVQSLAHASQHAGAQVSLTITDNTNDCEDTPRLAKLLRTWIDDGNLTAFKQFTFLQTGRNLGYGRANNFALARSGQPALLILNPDVLLHPNALTAALTHLSENDLCVLVTPRALAPEGQDLYLNHGSPSILALLGRALPMLRNIPTVRDSMSRYELRELPLHEAHDKTECASGCFMLLRTTAWRAAGGFDPDFFMYFEDYDLTQKLRQLGKVCYVPQVCVEHVGGQAALKGLTHQRLFARSAVRFFQRHGWHWK